MSSTRTISLLIALAFLPLAGFATAQSAPVEPTVSDHCDDTRPGTSVRESGNEIACIPDASQFTPDPSTSSPCDGGIEGTSIRENGNEVLCIPFEVAASLTVGFHTDGPDGPGEACDGASSNHITATIPPSPTPDFVIDDRIATTGCIMVTSDEGSASVGIPAADLPDAVVTISFYDGNFVPGPGPVTTGSCEGTESVALTLGASGPVPGTPPGETAQCVEVTVSLDNVPVLSVAAGIPAGIEPPTVPPCDPTTDAEACQALVCALLPDPTVCDEDVLPPGCDPTDEATFDPSTCAGLPGLDQGTLGYHAHFTFTPPIPAAEEPSFHFANNVVVIRADLYDSEGPAAFAAPGPISHRAQFVLSRFPPAADGADEDPLPDLQIVRAADSYSPDFKSAFLTVARDTLVTSSDEPGTVWTIRVESPNQPLVNEPVSDGMVPYPSAFSFYSAAATAAFDPENTALADVLDGIPTPIRALPKPFATIAAVTGQDRVVENSGGFAAFEVTVSPSPNAPSGWTDVEFTVASGAGQAEASDYELQAVSPATLVTANTIRVPGSEASSDRAVIRVVPTNDALLEYGETVELSIKETKDAAVDPESAISAVVTIADDEKPWVRILAVNSTLVAEEDGQKAATVVFERQSPDSGEPNPVLGAFELVFNRADSEPDVTLADFAAPPCTSPINPPEVGCVDPPVSSCPEELADSPLAGTPLDDVCAALAEALSAPAAGVQCGATLEADCTLSFVAGSNRTSVTFVPADDEELEMLNETFFVSLVSSPDDDYVLTAVAGEKRQTVTLIDNEVRPTISIAFDGPRTYEAGSPLKLTLTRTIRTDLVTNVPITVAGEGGLGTDFELSNLPGNDFDFEEIDDGFSVDMPADATSVTLLLKAVQDSEAEGTESVTFTLVKDLFALGVKKSATFLIGDDDPLPFVILRGLDNEAGEAGDAATLVVERVGGLDTDLAVSLEPVKGSAVMDQDFTLSTTQVNFAPGVSSAVVTLTPIDDELREGPEAVRIGLVDDGTFLMPRQSEPTTGPATADVLIADDDVPSVYISVPDADLAEEGATSAVVRIHRTAVDLDQPLTVVYTARGTAMSGKDFVALPGAATIPAGATSVDVEVKAVEDDLADANEQLTFGVPASALGAYARQLPVQTVLTILDNDLAPADDQDGDGLLNGVDPCPNHADADPADLDKDGKGDACDDDQDGDGATDVAELAAGTDARDADTDRDLVADGKEVADGSDPLDPYSPDYRAEDVEATLEDDGMHVTWTAADPRVGRFLVWRLSDPELVAEVNATAGSTYEVVDEEFPGGRHTYRVQAVLDGQSAAGFDAASSGASAPVFASLCTAQPLDSDGDELCDAREFELGTDPDVADSDGDGLGDGAETLGRYGDASDPLEVDSDGDGTDDGDEVDLESVSAETTGADLDAAWIGIAAVLAGIVLVLSLVGVVRFMRRD